MITFEMKNLSFRPGMELKIKGVPIPNCVSFQINVGSNQKNIGLHFSPRFNYAGDQRIIILSTRKDGDWQEGGKRERIFPFQWGQEFEVTITFSSDSKRFCINLQEGPEIEFPNLLAEKKYNYIFGADVEVNAISVTQKC